MDMGSRFIESRDYRNVKERFVRNHTQWVDESKLVIVDGESGRGKTKVGDKLALEFRDAFGRECMRKTINSTNEQEFGNSLQSIINDFRRSGNPIETEQRNQSISLTDICAKLNNDGTKCFFNFDNLPSTDVQAESQWRNMFWEILRSVEWPNLQDATFLMMVTTQGQPREIEFDEIKAAIAVEQYTMKGFDAKDTRKFLEVIFNGCVPVLWDENTVTKLKDKLSGLPSAYEASTSLIKSMSDQGELEDLEKFSSEAIKDKLQSLPHPDIWKLFSIYSEGLMIPKEYFLIIISQKILTNAGETEDHKILKQARSIFADMLDTYDRHGFITIHRPTPVNTREHTSEQMYISIQDLAMKALKDLPDTNDLDSVCAGLLAINKLLLKDDRHHKKTKPAPDYIPALLSLASMLYDAVVMTRQTRYKDQKDNIFERFTKCQRLMYFDVITAINYNKLRKEVVQVTECDFKILATSLEELENILSQITQQSDGNPGMYETPYMPDEERYELIMDYLDKPDDKEELKRMRQILHLTERDIRTIQGLFERQEDKTAVRPHGQNLLALNERQYEMWEEKNILLSVETLRKTYPLEILSSMYTTLAKMRKELPVNENQREGESLSKKSSEELLEKASRMLKAARDCEKKQLFELLERIVVDRDHLLVERKSKISRDDPFSEQFKRLKELSKKYHELKMLEKLAYEYGLLRSNMKKDHYNMLVCSEQRMDILVQMMLIQRREDQAQLSSLVDEFCNVYQGIQDPQTEKVMEPGVRNLLACELYPDGFEDGKHPTNRRAFAFTLRAIGRMLGSLCCTLQKLSFRYFTLSLKIIHEDPQTQITDNAVGKLCGLIKRNLANTFYPGAVQKIKDTFDVCICYDKNKLTNERLSPPCDVCGAESLLSNYLNKFDVTEMNETHKSGINQLKDVLRQSAPTQ